MNEKMTSHNTFVLLSIKVHVKQPFSNDREGSILSEICSMSFVNGPKVNFFQVLYFSFWMESKPIVRDSSCSITDNFMLHKYFRDCFGF